MSVSRAAEKPLNILILYADDLGYGIFSIQPGFKIPTPNLNALLSGMKFTDAIPPQGYARPLATPR